MLVSEMVEGRIEQKEEIRIKKGMLLWKKNKVEVEFIRLFSGGFFRLLQVLVLIIACYFLCVAIYEEQMRLGLGESVKNLFVVPLNQVSYSQLAVLFPLPVLCVLIWLTVVSIISLSKHSPTGYNKINVWCWINDFFIAHLVVLGLGLLVAFFCTLVILAFDRKLDNLPEVLPGVLLRTAIYGPAASWFFMFFVATFTLYKEEPKKAELNEKPLTRPIVKEDKVRVREGTPFYEKVKGLVGEVVQGFDETNIQINRYPTVKVHFDDNGQDCYFRQEDLELVEDSQTEENEVIFESTENS